MRPSGWPDVPVIATQHDSRDPCELLVTHSPCESMLPDGGNSRLLRSMVAEDDLTEWLVALFDPR